MTNALLDIEKALIRNCINEDRKSQRKLYNLYFNKMFFICLRYSKDHQMAEDVMQEAFIKLFKNLKNFRDEGSFEGWVKRIFINTALTFKSKQSNIVELKGLEDTIVDKNGNGLDNLYRKDLVTITNTLSEGCRTVFLLYAIEGYSHKEIGKKLGISESTSKSQFCRAKVKLKKMIDKRTAIELQIAV